MEFLSVQFAFFALITITGFHLVRHRLLRRAILTGSSLAFASSFFPSAESSIPFIAFFLFQLTLYHIVFWVPSAYRSAVSGIALAANLLLFLVIKGYVDIPLDRSLWVTAGISYMFFRSIQLLSDAGDGTLERADVSLLDIILFNLSFLTFAAGPIQTFQSFRSELNRSMDSRFSEIGWRDAGRRALLGGLKLLILAPFLEPMTQQILATPGVFQFVKLGLACTVFLLYIYISFSGYMDWIIAFGRALGFSVPENFDRPWRAANFLDLWARWHITLSEAFRTYVFNPLLRLLLLKVIPGRRVAAGAIGYFTVFFLLGSWHGPSLRFMTFGLVLGALAAMTKLWQTYRTGSVSALDQAMETAPGQVFSAALSLGLLAMACVFTLPGWEMDQILDLLHGPARVAASTTVSVAAAAGLVIVARLLERVEQSAVLSGSLRRVMFHPASVLVWLGVLVIVNSLLKAPLPDALVYYQRF